MWKRSDVSSFLRWCGKSGEENDDTRSCHKLLILATCAVTGATDDLALILARLRRDGRHRHDLTLTRWTLMQKTETDLGGADLSTRRRVINSTIALIKHEEAEAEAARGRHANDKLTTPGFDDGARGYFAVGVATGLGVPCDGVRATGACAGSVIVETSVTVDGDAEAAAAFASLVTEPANPLGNEFGPCAVPGVRVDELAVMSAVPEEVSAEAPAEAPAEPAPPPAPAVTDNGPLRSAVVVFYGDDDDGGLWDYVAGVDGGLGEEAEAERRDSGGASAAVAAAAIGLRLQLSQLLYTGLIARPGESSSPPAPEFPSPLASDDASTTGRTYDDITKSPPPHLRCVVSPLSSLPPVLRCTAALLPHFLSPRSGG